MARFPTAEPIYQAADLFRSNSLTAGRSTLWPSRKSWTPNTIEQLWNAIIEHPDLSKRSFEQKLQDQLKELPDDCHAIAADSVAFYHLFSVRVNPATKTTRLRDMLSWRRMAPPENIGAFERAFAAGGIGSPGAHYNMSKPWQLAYILRFASIASANSSTLSDPGAAKAIADKALLEMPSAPEMRHIILHLLFPDNFERTASRDQKARIVTAFSSKAGAAQDADEAIANIRRALEAERGRGTLDFYDNDIYRLWGLDRGESGLKENLEAILAQYTAARSNEPFGNQSAMYQQFRRIEKLFGKSEPVRRRSEILVKASQGQGNWARVPWIAFLDSRETSSTQRGVYCVYLFREDMSGVYLTLNQGVTEPTKREGKPAAEQLLRGQARDIRLLFPQLVDDGFELSDAIDLRPSGNLGEAYEVSTIAHKLYSATEIPSDDELLADLDTILEAYSEYVARKVGNAPPPTQPHREPPDPDITLRDIAEDFARNLLSCSISFGARHDDIVRSFVASMATKRFAILTGLAGSGKTQLALRFGEWLGREHSLVVPVRPDWTGPDALFGYEDALKEPSKERRAWHVPKPLEFILQCAANPRHPYLLVLDEMNLAHVERYFADFLSGIESEYPCLPNLKPESDNQWRVPEVGPHQIPIPPNLLVVGTVNVDETTYMFSPKVLDRANTFEFRVQTSDLDVANRKPTPMASGDPLLTSAFLAISTDDNWHRTFPAPGEALFAQHLRTLHGLLSQAGFEFGHRVFYESIRFAAMFAAAGDIDPLDALDLQVVQKVLPRIHGSRRRVEAVLCALGQFCHDLSFDLGIGLRDSVGRFDQLLAGGAKAKLPISFGKVTRMTQSLRMNQFVSFTE